MSDDMRKCRGCDMAFRLVTAGPAPHDYCSRCTEEARPSVKLGDEAYREQLLEKAARVIESWPVGDNDWPFLDKYAHWIRDSDGRWFLDVPGGTIARPEWQERRSQVAAGPGPSSTACDDQLAAEWPEERMDTIGRNGGDGEHYAGPSYAECRECGDRHVDGSTGAEFIGWHGHCSVCEMQDANSSEIPNSSDEGPLMQAARDGMKRAAEKWARGDMSASVSRHYQHSVRVPVTAADLERGYAIYKLDPYRVCDLYSTGGGPREQMIKKLLRWTDKGQDEDQVLREIGSALDRWHEMRAEDVRSGS